VYRRREQRFTRYVDWRTKEDVLKEMRSRVAKLLRGAHHVPSAAKQLAAEIVGLAKSRPDSRGPNASKPSSRSPDIPQRNTLAFPEVRRPRPTQHPCVS